MRLIVLVVFLASVVQAGTLASTHPPTLRTVLYVTSPSPLASAIPWYVDLWKEGIGAFLGAFFAFLSVKVAEYTRDRFERQRRNRRALNRLQHTLNDYLGILNDDIWVVTKLKANVERGLTHWSFPRPLPIDKSIYDDLLSLDVVNRLRSLYDTARKINDDIGNAMAGYEAIRQIYVGTVAAGEPAVKFYKDNAGEMVNVFEIGARAQRDFMDVDVVGLLSLVRVLSKKGAGVGVKLLLLGLKTPTVSEDEVEAERARLILEMNQIQAESRARIDKLFEKDAQG